MMMSPIPPLPPGADEDMRRRHQQMLDEQDQTMTTTIAVVIVGMFVAALIFIVGIAKYAGWASVLLHLGGFAVLLGACWVLVLQVRKLL